MQSPPDKKGIHFSILQKITLGFGLAVLLLLLIAIITYRSTKSFLTTAGEVAHSHQVLEVHEMLLRHLMEAESGERGFVITGDSIYLLTYTSASLLISQDMERLKDLTVNNPKQQFRLKKIEPLILSKLEVVKNNITARQVGGDAKAAEAFASGEDRELMAKIRDNLTEFADDEQVQLQQGSRLFERTGKVTSIVIVFGTLTGVLFLGAAMWLILRDVMRRRTTEEELAEERNLLSVLIETIPHQVYVKDVEGRFVMDNESHREHIGVMDILDVNGTRATDYFPDDLAKIYKESDEKAMYSDTPVINEEEPGVDREGNLVWLATTKMPLYDTSGEVVGLVGLSEDITERKHAEEMLRHYAWQMERSNKELEEFASVASHDLQEPLRKISAFGHRLKTTCSEGLGEQGRDYLDRMLGAATRMQTLISDLLTLSRVASAARPFKEVDLAQIAQDVVSDLELQIERTGALVEVGFLPKIEADTVQMRQLFQNLISNGIKFHRPDEKPHVSISAKVLEMKDYQLAGVMPGEKACRIVVQDNGIGFSEEYADKIFALFQRLHGRNEYEGTGIGLAVCRKITDRHGGNIVAKSAEGDGATFIVTLPVKQTTNTTHEH